MISTDGIFIKGSIKYYDHVFIKICYTVGKQKKLNQWWRGNLSSLDCEYYLIVG